MKVLIHCFGCGKKFLRDRRHVYENTKLGQNNYCSLQCLSKNRRKRVWLVCNNTSCGKRFQRKLGAATSFNYCSRSCAASVNNVLHPKRSTKSDKNCFTCGLEFGGKNKLYCSAPCKYRAQEINKDTLIGEIRDFFSKYKRIPFKKELKHYRSIRTHFGTWNNAVIVAGYNPNPARFAMKHIANDGHKCDSLSEKIIDDWLFARHIKHKINYPYPGKKRFTADFKVYSYWIEFFGLSGQHSKYDELMTEKLELVKLHKLKLIQIYPDHLFKKDELDKTLNVLLN